MADNDVEITVMVRDLASAGLRGIASVGRGLGASVGPIMSLGKGLAAVGAAGGAINVVAGLGAALTAAAPAALVLPGIMLGAAAAVTTFKLAFSGMGEAISAADPAAFAEATKNMAPAARETAQAVRDLKPAFEDMKRSIQGAVFEGLATQITKTGTVLMDVLGPGLTQIGRQFNDMGYQAITAARNPFFTDDLTQITDNTSAALGNMGGVVADLMSGFVGLGAVGSDYLPAIGQAAGDAAERFKQWVDSGVESGAIKDSIDAALVVLRQFGEVAGNVGGIVKSIFTGLSGGDSASFLANLVAITEQLEAFFASAQAQTTLAALGEALRAVSAAMGQVFLTALQAVFPIIEALAPVVVALATAFQAALVDSGLLTTVGTLLADLVTALVDSGLMDAFVQLAATVGGVLATALAALAPVLVDIATAFGELLTTAVQQLVDSGLLDRLVAVVVRILDAVLPLIPSILELAMAAFPLFIAGVEAAVPVLEFLAGVIEFLSPILQGLIDMVSMTVAAMTGDFSAIQAKADEWRAGIGRAVDGVVAWFRDLPGRVMGFLSALPGQLADSGWRMLQSFADGIRRGFESAMGAVRNGISAIRNFFPFSPAKTGPFSGQGYVDHSGEALVGDFAASIRASTPQALREAAALAGGVQAALGGAAMGRVGVAAGAGVGAEAGALGAGVPGAAGVLELRVAPGAQNALAELIMRMVRTGELQIVAGAA